VKLAVGKNLAGCLELFAVDVSGNLYYKWQGVPNGGFNGWVVQGRDGKYEMQIGAQAEGRVVLLKIGTDSTIGHMEQHLPNGDRGWGNWIYRSAPSGFSLGGLCVTCTNNALYDDPDCQDRKFLASKRISPFLGAGRTFLRGRYFMSQRQGTLRYATLHVIHFR
jgi:hypothetical protein